MPTFNFAKGLEEESKEETKTLPPQEFQCNKCEDFFPITIQNKYRQKIYCNKCFEIIKEEQERKKEIKQRDEPKKSNVVIDDRELIDKIVQTDTFSTLITEMVDKKIDLVIERKNIDDLLGNVLTPKINEQMNSRLLKLVEIGVEHELTLENLERHLKEVRKTKLYELQRHFSQYRNTEIERLVNILIKEGKLKKDTNRWLHYIPDGHVWVK